jgi:putative oxidoreductase
MADADSNGAAMLSLARWAFGLFFVGSAILKYIAADVELAMLVDAGFAEPLPWLIFAASAQLAGGMALLINRLVRLAALGLFAYVGLVNFFLHPFWVLTGEAWSIQFQLFTKNLGIMAGLLAIAGAARTWGIQNVWTRKEELHA